MALDHFKDPNYQGDRGWWNFNVLFDNQPAVHQMVKEYAPVLDHPGLYAAIPPQWLHTTVVAVGPITTYTEQEMLAVVELVRPKLSGLKPPEFAFDPWWLWGGCVVLHITPEDQFTKIYDYVIEALETVVGPDRTRKAPYGSFLPHLTLAYARENHQDLELHQQLVDHPVKPVTFKDIKLSLIKQFPEDGYYKWKVIKELPIGR